MSRKAQKRQIDLKAKNPRKIMTALRKWVRSSEKISSDPLQLDDAPPWVTNACIEVAKIMMPGGRLPTTGEMDPETLGAILGRLEAIGRVFGGEIPVSAETKADWELFEKQAASQPKSPERTAREKMLTKDIETRMYAANQAAPALMAAALSSSHEDALKFQKGLVHGMTLSAEDFVQGNVLERHTRTFLLLACQWRVFARCRSVGEIHRILCKACGEQQVGSLKTFQKRVVEKIGLKVAERGRPTKHR